MNIAVISDLTFDLVLKQLNPDNRYTVKKYVYADPVVPELLKAGSQLDGVDTLIIHFDSYFFRYTDAYIAEILQAVRQIAEQFSGNILLSNNMVNGRHTSILKNNVGQYEQSIFENEICRQINTRYQQCLLLRCQKNNLADGPSASLQFQAWLFIPDALYQKFHHPACNGTGFLYPFFKNAGEKSHFH
jgi:hypothetical protein